MITTEAWVLHKDRSGGHSALDTGDLRKEAFSFPEPGPGEVLVEPLFGCWEGNMGHAVARSPIDVCAQRGEEKVILGNAGVMRVLAVGPSVHGIAAGDLGALFCGQDLDPFGYPRTIYGYDAPGSLGLLARRTKVPAHCFVPVPAGSRISLESWAAFSLRYVTAWANWRVAYGAYRLQVSEDDDPAPYVLGWGGGCTWAELDLARRHGCEVGMVTGDEPRLASLATMGIRGFDRRDFPDIEFDAARYAADPAYRERHRASKRALLDGVAQWTSGRGVAIFIDYMGGPVNRVTLDALGREGVLTTAGWKLGMRLAVNRALECIGRHLHVHTHYARRAECDDAMAFAEANGWAPEVTVTHDWDAIPELARADADGALCSYFPVYRVNAP